LLGQITTTNDKLHQYLDRTPETFREQVVKPKVSFRELQDQAHDLYQGLASTWQCSCPDAHAFGITVNPSPNAREGSNEYFRIIFDDVKEKRQFRIRFEETQPVGRVEGASSPHIDLEAVGVLNKQILQKKQQKKVAQEAGDKSTASLASASSPVLSNTPGRPNRKSILTRATHKLRRWSSSRSAEKNCSTASLPKQYPSLIVAKISPESSVGISTLDTVSSASSIYTLTRATR
jgi:hypothetical protein